MKSASLPAVAAHCDRVLKHRTLRLVLSGLIILSLLPFPWVHGLEPWLLPLFGVEFFLRFLSTFSASPERGPGALDAPGRRRIRSIALLALDFIALLSFFPWAVDASGARWLRLFRLSRMVLLIGYWAPVMHDLSTVLIRRGRARQLAVLGIIVAMMSFAGAVILDHLSTPGMGAGEGFSERLWWSFRQLQDPGNMVAQPKNAATLLVSLGLTVVGLFLVSFLIGLGADMVREMMALSRGRPPGLQGHTAIIRVDPSSEALLGHLTRYYRKLFTSPKFAVLGRNYDRPDWLLRPEYVRVAYRASDGESGFALERVDTGTARRIVILGDHGQEGPDAETIGLILAARDANSKAWLVAEILDQSNISAARVAGGPQTVIVPTEKLLALIVASYAECPDRDPLLGQLLSSDGHELYSFIFDHPGLEGPGTALSAEAPVSLSAMIARAVHGHEGRALTPVGLLRPCDEGHEGVRVELGIPDEGTWPAGPVRGVVALAQNFDLMRTFGESLELPTPAAQQAYLAQEEDPKSPYFEALQFEATMGPPARVLLCGWRPASLTLCALLLEASGAAEIRVMVPDDAAALAGVQDLEEHAAHIRSGLLEEVGPQGCFERVAERRYAYRLGRRSTGGGGVAFVVGDCTSERQLMSLPGFGAGVGTMDLVVLFGASDAQMAVSALKIADLRAVNPSGFAPGFRLVAAVSDDKLGARLQARLRHSAGGPDAAKHWCVISSQTLRAHTTFQSVVVPAFDPIYATLLSPGGPSLRPMVLTPNPRRPESRWTVAKLSVSLARRRYVLVAVDLMPSDGSPGNNEGPRGLLAVPNEALMGRSIPWSDLRRAWVIAYG